MLEKKANNRERHHQEAKPESRQETEREKRLQAIRQRIETILEPAPQSHYCITILETF